jgi:hypothetical protein
MSEANVQITTPTPTVRRLEGGLRGASARTGWEASPAPDPKQSVQSMQEANVQDGTPMPIVGRELEEGAFSVPLKAAEIPKVISWQPGVSRPPAPALAPAPSVRNKPSKPVPFAGSDLLLTRSDHRVVAVDVLAIDRREKHRLAGSPAEGLRDRALLLVGFAAAPPSGICNQPGSV